MNTLRCSSKLQNQLPALVILREWYMVEHLDNVNAVALVHLADLHKAEGTLPLHHSGPSDGSKNHGLG